MKRAIAGALILITAGLSAVLCLNAPPAGMAGRVFTVNRGETVRAIARNLRREGLIRSVDFFVLASRGLRRQSVRAGNYRIFPGMTSLEILRALSRGEVMTRRVVVPEGFNLFQIADRLEANGVSGADEFLRYAEDKTFLASIGIAAPTAEGYLFPDTYAFAEGSDPRDIITLMHRKMTAVIGDDAGEGMDRHRALTLASLIEKEAKVPSERAAISAVFHNRLKLDCDPTVRYATKRFTGPIRVSDLNSDSPYNTYRRAGLPPTPICMPGRESIAAALRPERSDYLYFVAKNDGSHQFSKTLGEHHAAVRRWQR